MTGLSDLVDIHYGSTDLWARIEQALNAAGIDAGALSRDVTAGFDEFHGGGRASTRALARLAEIKTGEQVLDIGCGVGGPARTLAAEFGARVTGLDLTREFVRVAALLSARLPDCGEVHFLHGSATDMPLEDASFDLVWSQNMMMNVEDKPGLFAEVARVLRPGGRFAFEAVIAGSGEPLMLPTFWAATEALNFLVDEATLREQLAAAGLREWKFEDNTAAVVANGLKRRAAMAAPAADAKGFTVAVIVPERAGEKMANSLANNELGRTRAVQGVFVREPG